jgi:hypothetical protein
MKATGQKFSVLRGKLPLLADGRLRSRVVFLLTLACGLFPFAFSSSAHEPITTKVRFNKEVVRTLQRNCLGCHHPGGIAMSLATYDDARPWAKAIKEEVLEKRMPPWRAVKGFGEFRNAPSLTQHDIDVLINWIEGGAPKGDEKDLPTDLLFTNDWQLGKPDLVLKPESETKIAADADEYRSFALPTNLKEDRWLSAVDVQPGNRSVVHCVTLYLVRGETGVQSPEPMMQIRDERPDPRVPMQSLLTSWMPGQTTVAFEGGVAQLVPAGSRIEARIHYHGAGEATSDLSKVGLYFAKAPPRKQIQQIQITKPEAAIRIAAEPQPLKMSITIQTDTEAVAIRPQVNPLIVSLQATAYLPDGSEQVLIWTRGYQYDWNPTYYFLRPVALPKGTRVEVIAYFDNSGDNPHNPNDPPKALAWSDLSADPLCMLLVTSGGSGSSASTAR